MNKLRFQMMKITKRIPQHILKAHELARLLLRSTPDAAEISARTGLQLNTARQLIEDTELSAEIRSERAVLRSIYFDSVKTLGRKLESILATALPMMDHDGNAHDINRASSVVRELTSHTDAADIGNSAGVLARQGSNQGTALAFDVARGGMQ